MATKKRTCKAERAVQVRLSTGNIKADNSRKTGTPVHALLYSLSAIFYRLLLSATMAIFRLFIYAIYYFLGHLYHIKSG